MEKVAHFTLEFFRYALVGGVAFLADFCALVVSRELLFRGTGIGVYIATAVGFLVGLTVNYVLSLFFVFIDENDKGKGRTIMAFAIFAAVGIMGLVWTEIGMWFGVDVLKWDYKIIKVLVAGVVLMWNYLGRKILVF